MSLTIFSSKYIPQSEETSLTISNASMDPKLIKNRKIKSLNISNSAMESDKVVSLLNNLHIQSLSSLNMQFNTNIGKIGQDIIKSNLMFYSSCSIQNINLGFCGLMDLKMRYFLSGIKMNKLRVIRMYFNSGIGVKGWQLIRECALVHSLNSLKQIDLEKCHIDDKKLNIIFQNLEFSELHTINLKDNQIEKYMTQDVINTINCKRNVLTD